MARTFYFYVEMEINFFFKTIYQNFLILNHFETLDDKHCFWRTQELSKTIFCCTNSTTRLACSYYFFFFLLNIPTLQIGFY